MGTAYNRFDSNRGIRHYWKRTKDISMVVFLAIPLLIMLGMVVWLTKRTRAPVKMRGFIK